MRGSDERFGSLLSLCGPGGSTSRRPAATDDPRLGECGAGRPFWGLRQALYGLPSPLDRAGEVASGDAPPGILGGRSERHLMERKSSIFSSAGSLGLGWQGQARPTHGRGRAHGRIDVEPASVGKRTDRSWWNRLACGAGRQYEERLLETYTLVVDGIAIIAFVVLIARQRPRRRAEGRRPRLVRGAIKG